MTQPSVLVVEDHELNRELLVQLLEDDYRLLTATDGRTGLELARRKRPDVVLLDLSLPELDGWTVARQIKSDESLAGTTVIALTAHAMPGDEEKARAAGCDDYLTKPVDEELLLTRLRAHVTTHSEGADG